MKFNFTNKGKDTIVNYMGAKACRMTPEMELYSTVVTCVVDDSYYESNVDRITPNELFYGVYLSRIEQNMKIEINFFCLLPCLEI